MKMNRCTGIIILTGICYPLVNGFAPVTVWYSNSHSHVHIGKKGPLGLQAENGSAANDERSCDVLVLGSGPAARAAASLFSKRGDRNVILADKNFDKPWIPNYGVWQDEWEAVSERYSMCGIDTLNSINRKWEMTDCYFGGSFGIPTEERFRVNRPYWRVDRIRLQDVLTNHNCYEVIKANHESKMIGLNLFSPPDSLVHDENGSTIRLSDGTVVKAKLIVDCTGHESKLISKNPEEDGNVEAGYQIAYGLTADVEPLEEGGEFGDCIGPYDKEAMTLFDYRTDHFVSDSVEEKKATADPTFMYAMPLSGNEIFFEETSLVARPAISFQECKDRCMTRLEHLGIKVLKIKEEEFCYIPMGGPLPARDQRIIGFGGAAAMVHPSTGYHICRALIAAADLVDAVEMEFKEFEENGIFNPNRAAANAYNALWSPSNISQRNFAVFGGEFLMKQNVVGLRGFFNGFFRLPQEMWAGFLAGWPGLPNNEKHESWAVRMLFGVTFLSKLPPAVAADMLFSIITTSLSGTALIQSVTPLFGNPLGYVYKESKKQAGDVAAKSEAKQMMTKSDVVDFLPVEFNESSAK